MNYDLLKLSKILPTLNGKKTIDVFQERLDYARAQQGGEVIQEPAKQQFTNSELQRGRPKPMKKESRGGVGDSKSSGNILMGNYSFPIKDYSNLQVLLEGDEEADHFAYMFKNSFRTESHKNQKNSFQSTGSSFFGKKNASEVSFQARPITTNTQSNFVFRKKKADFANKFQTESLYNYGLEKISHTMDEDQFGLNGKKMSMREMSNDVVVRQQKKYLKELKLDPLTIFRSKLPGTDEASESPQRFTRDTSSPSGYKKPFLISRCNQRSLKKNLQKSQQSFHLNYRETKPEATRQTLTLDGSQFRSVEQNKTHETPTVTPKKHSKGFSQYVNTLE